MDYSASYRQKSSSKAISKKYNLVLSKQADTTNNLAYKSYKRATYCCETVAIDPKDNKIRSLRYCHSRTCKVCMNIRTGKFINEVSPILARNELAKSLYFVTLTAPTIECLTPERLHKEIKFRQQQWRNALKILRRHNIFLSGIRTMEVVISESNENHYHPHFHCIIEGENDAEALRTAWLKTFKGTEAVGQDVRPLDDQGRMEILKYATKLWKRGNKDGKPFIKSYPVKKLDLVYRALYRCRLLSTFGNIKNLLQEALKNLDNPDTEKGEIFLDYRWNWSQEHHTWINENGEKLVDYVLSDEIKNLKVE